MDECVVPFDSVADFGTASLSGLVARRAMAAGDLVFVLHGGVLTDGGLCDGAAQSFDAPSAFCPVAAPEGRAERL